MTEDEATTKWCPFARPGAARPDDCGEVRGNRLMQGEADDGALCIGSACMAWREEIVNIARVPADGTCESKFPFADGWRIVRSRLSDNTLELKQVTGSGYCGLAGAPQ